MKSTKKIIVLIITTILLSMTIFTQYMVVPARADILSDAFEANNILSGIVGVNDDASINMFRDVLYKNVLGTGFVSDLSRWQLELVRKGIANYLNNKYGTSGKTQDNITQSDINETAKDFIDNTTQTNNEITYNNTSKSIMNYVVNEYMNDSGFWYCYTAEWHDSVTTYPNGTMYNRLASIIHNAQDTNYCIVRSGVNVLWCVTIPKDNDIKFVANGQSNATVNAVMYNGESWQQLNNTTIPDGYHIYKIVNENGTVNTYDGTDWNLVDGYWNYFIVGSMLFNPKIPVANSGNWGGIGGSGYYMAYSNTYCYLVYKNLESMKLGQQGEQSYYVSNNWQDYSNSGNSSYTVDSSNSNNITYGDVTNYITNNTTDGNPPSPTQIQVYIDNNNPSGGGNGGGSGGGNGGGSGLGDVLGTLGSLIGSLISGIGQFLIGIFQGLVNAINSLISLIGDAIGGIVESIPSAFNDFMTSILGWLPPEWTAIISASLLIMVIVGIIKLIRG